MTTTALYVNLALRATDELVAQGLNNLESMNVLAIQLAAILDEATGGRESSVALMEQQFLKLLHAYSDILREPRKEETH